jgi:putative peptidoglycan lipid II flippase
MVAAGILLSRLVGLIRNRVFAHYFGTSDAADAFNAAFRIPNFLQNLFGEGVLSASFIPVYAGLRARDETEEAGRVAGAVAALLGVATAVLVLLGVLLTPWLIAVIAPGFEGAKRELTIRLVRILFPGAGLLVLSAWCLGVLNSHRRFFLSYAAPVLWNLAIIASLIAFGRGLAQYRLAEVAAWGSVVGSLLQLGVQLPTVGRLLGGIRPRLVRESAHVREVLRNFGPVFVGRGVVQISAYVDTVLASLLPTGAVAGLSYAQVLYTLPVSLFGMSVSASELPAMASAVGSESERAAYLRGRLDGGLRQIAFFVVPSGVAFLALGDVIAGALYQSGAFTHGMTLYVWGILAGSAVGLLASTMGRLYASTYYALHDTRTPLRFAVLRVALTIGLGYVFALPLPPALGLDARWGAAGLTASAGIAGWVEFVLLRRALNARIGRTGLPGALVARLWAAAAAAAGAAWGLRLGMGPGHPVVTALVLLSVYGGVYLLITYRLAVPEARAVLGRLRPREPGPEVVG